MAIFFKIFKLLKKKDYSLSDLSTNAGFKHQKVSNLYSQVPVCNFCQILYKKIDIFRSKVQIYLFFHKNIILLKILEGKNLSKNAPLSLDEISKEVTKYFSNNPSNPGILSTESKERRLFSSEFMEKIANFDKITSEFETGPSIAKTTNGFPVEPVIDLYERPSHFQVF